MTATETGAATILPEGWGMVIGLEVHCELATETKLFCACANNFGDVPNANTCPTCLGLPGSLPVLNEKAVELAMRLGRALQCTVNRSVFARKNYFYPDQPKDYQISQYDLPTNEHGLLDLPSGLRVGITRAHIEEDTGKLTHVGGGGRIHDAGYSLVDYNRSGVPLVEIVSEADLRSSDQAKEYVSELRAILLATAVSDAKMEEGSMRVDANVSVHRTGEPWGTRCEIKNLNSLRSLGRAIDHEALRQVDLLNGGETVRQETRHWDESTGRTGTLRVKEDADDYRYFPEPDLVPLDPTPEVIAAIDAALPVLPAARRTALATVAGVEPTRGAVAIAVERGLDTLATAAIAAGADGDRVLTHVEHNLAVDGAAALQPDHLAALVTLETTGKLTATQAKAVLAEMVEHPDKDPVAIAAEKGYEAMDTGALEALVDEIIAAHPDEWAQFVAGDDKARGKLTGFFMGKVMQASSGQADGKAATAVLRSRARRVTMRRLLSAVAVAVLAVGGCSDDDADDDGGAAPDATEIPDFDGDPASQFCTVLRDVQVDGLLEGPVESTTDVEAGFARLIFVLASAADHAPPELETDVSLVLEGIVAFDAAMRTVDYSYDALEQSPRAPELSAALNDPSFEVAGDRIEAYKSQVCGL